MQKVALTSEAWWWECLQKNKERIMKRNLIFSCILAVVVLTGCAGVKEPQVTQVSTIDALLVGAYDGVMSVQKLKQYGNLGIGTVDGLDGELIVLDDSVYHVKADGVAYLLRDDATVPFAGVVNFQTQKNIALNNVTDFTAFTQMMENEFPNPNTIMVFRIEGKFRTVKTRSVPKQQKPYQPLAEVTKKQPEFQLKEVQGVLVGFRLPAYVKGINVPGWHLHFIDENRKAGGHVLAFDIEQANLEACEVFDFRLILPQNSEEFSQADLSIDRSQELHQVESERK